MRETRESRRQLPGWLALWISLVGKNVASTLFSKQVNIGPIQVPKSPNHARQSCRSEVVGAIDLAVGDARAVNAVSGLGALRFGARGCMACLSACSWKVKDRQQGNPNLCCECG